MSYYGFKPNPKQLVTNKARALYGAESRIVVTGRRMSTATKTSTYYVECTVNGEKIASTDHRDWRKAYNLLVIEVEKAYEESLHSAPTV